MTRSLLADAFEHHVWATIALIDACLVLSPDQLQTSVPGTYGSILETMRHSVAADVGYLGALTGGAIPEIEADRMSLSELRSIMERDGGAWTAFLATDPDPDADCARRRDDGTRSHALIGVRLAQVIHHGTDHRSQICTALTSLGIEPPDIDVWALAWLQGRLHED
jgi:uncharacterized damage-inducible protein DinB